LFVCFLLDADALHFCNWCLCLSLLFWFVNTKIYGLLNICKKIMLAIKYKYQMYSNENWILNSWYVEVGSYRDA
jgi:hypothetical protein